MSPPSHHTHAAQAERQPALLRHVPQRVAPMLTLQAALRHNWKIGPGIHTIITRPPRARHRHPGRFGALVCSERTISIERDRASAHLRRRDHEHSISGFPIPLLPASPPLERQKAMSNAPGRTIDRYNQHNDRSVLLERCLTGRTTGVYCRVEGLSSGNALRRRNRKAVPR
jgi:hypothetical protein